MNHPYWVWRRRLAALAAACLLLCPLSAAAQPEGQTAAAGEENAAPPSAAQAEEAAPRYADYRAAREGKDASAAIVIAATDFTRADGGAQPSVLSDAGGREGQSLLLPESGSVSWAFTVQEEGYYALRFDYLPAQGGGSSALRDVLVDGELPFQESAQLVFERRWVNGDTSLKDADGNQIRPRQQEEAAWMIKEAEDPAGLTEEPLRYYLTAGTHLLTLSAQREPLILGKITWHGAESAPAYSQLQDTYRQEGYAPAPESAWITLEAEDAQAKSDQTMYPLSDRTTPSVSPYSASKMVYNTVGGTQWQTVGQWMEWSVHIEEDGLYNIAAHFRQDMKSSGASARELTIDGKRPFREAGSLSFAYGRGWKCAAFADEAGEPYRFFLEEGDHTIRLRVTLGDAVEVIAEADGLLSELNAIYRKIVVVTGPSPDRNRDYFFEDAIPDVLDRLRAADEKLNGLITQLRGTEGMGNQAVQSLSQLARYMDEMVEDPDTIAKHLGSFRDSISTMATWRNGLMEQPLTLDRLYLVPAGAELPAGDVGFFQLIWHYLRQFVYSFTSDYASVGNMDVDASHTITAWMITGQDQAQVLRQLINERFTPESSVSVQLQLVAADALMPSLAAKTGPDVFLGLLQTEPMNLVLRGALRDLSDYPGFAELSTEFYDNAMEPFRFQGGTYALPETLTYQMLFYRKDILRELEVETADLECWDTVLKKVMPLIQKNALQFGVTANVISYNGYNSYLSSYLRSYLTFLYQAGGAAYSGDGRTSALASAEAIDAMRRYTMLFTQYQLPLAFDFANRFRSGEMPIAITDFTAYNQLTVFAPEIKGMWGMLPVPGTRQADGTVDHSTAGILTGSVMFSSAEDPDACWEFLRWWASADIQAVYGTALESVVGSAARYNSANQVAMERIQWDMDTKEQLQKQLAFVRPLPEQPGGYLTSRQFDFAFRDIVYNSENIRETLTEAVTEIDAEMAKKRAEYKLE